MTFLRIHPDDDVLVALESRAAGDAVTTDVGEFALQGNTPHKQKVLTRTVAAGDVIRMYGLIVARAVREIRQGEMLTPQNAVDATEPLRDDLVEHAWQRPDVSQWQGRTFAGLVRDDGRVGTRNYWIVVPMVFCENRNLRVMREALVEELGYAAGSEYRSYARRLLEMAAQGRSAQDIASVEFSGDHGMRAAARPFPQVDGVKFLAHDGGCGGAYHDSQALSGLLAGYINHPNVAGATVLSLGCQKAQLDDLHREISRRNAKFEKPLLVFEQQRIGREDALMQQAIRHTIAGLMKANQVRREPVPLSHLAVGLECGGSDGFSGVTANPAMGHCSDLLAALGATTILAEFPELAGCENDLVSRCVTPELGERFVSLMRGYQRLLEAHGVSFSDNPSPGNIQEGLVTDAMKSAGAARKGGLSPVVDVLDYPEPVEHAGLNLLCTPGNDVESTTALAGSGATAMLFSTGLGTPTGNPIAPVLKISSNSQLARRMPDIIDYDAGGIVDGDAQIESVGEALVELLISTASGEMQTKAERLGQDDFIPWKRTTSF